MADSSLVRYEDYDVPHTSGREGSGVGCICVHHMAGNLSPAQCADVWRGSGAASAHYAIQGSLVGQLVREEDAAWAVGNWAANKYTISIECANDGGAASNWHVSDETIETCINLIVDICRRKGWKEFRYTGDDNTGELTAHRWYTSTACPGDYLYSKFPYIASEVQRRLDGKGIAEDGVIGYDTIYNWQKVIGSPYTDGEISGQMIAAQEYVTAVTDAWVFDNGNGSETIRKWQSMVGVEADGYFGEDSARATQKFLNKELGAGLAEDGILGYESSLALQKWINSKLGA